MYQQLRQDLLARIRRGEFGPGDLLPSESRLCDQYGVSAITARRALLELVKEGAVQRKAGVGTTVALRVPGMRLSFLSINYRGDAWRRTPSAMGELVAGIGEQVWQRDAALSMTGVEEDEAATHLRGLVEERAVDGVLLRTADDISEEYLEVLEGAGMPYVVVKRHIPGRMMNCVVSDDVAGARMATGHLLDLGYRRVGFVCAKPRTTVGRERLAGYKAALEEWGTPFDEALVRQEPYFTVRKGREAVEALLALPDPPTAIFVASDTMALGAYEAVRELGLEIPEDVALVGYDDIAPVAVLQPPLTTVRTSYYEFGRLAAQLLLNLVEGRVVPPQRRVIEPTLVVRGSTVRGVPAAEPPREGALRFSKAVTGREGRLGGKQVVLSAMGEGKLGRDIARTLEAEGAEVASLNGEVGTLPGHFDAFVHGFDAGAGLEEALTLGREAAGIMSRRGGGNVVYVAHSGGEPVARAARRAALAPVVEALAWEWSGRGVRFNGLVVGGGNLASPLALLASDDGASLNGETLTVDAP